MNDLQAHLLVVDDDERIRGLLQKFLIRNGYLVSVARDAAQARVEETAVQETKPPGGCPGGLWFVALACHGRDQLTPPTFDRDSAAPAVPVSAPMVFCHCT